MSLLHIGVSLGDALDCFWPWWSFGQGGLVGIEMQIFGGAIPLSYVAYLEIIIHLKILSVLPLNLSCYFFVLFLIVWLF